VEQELSIRLDFIHDRFQLAEPAAAVLGKTELKSSLSASRDWPAVEGNRRSTNHYLLAKRLFDIAIATLCGFALAPVMLLLAVAVMVDVGHPIIFWQQRPGIRGKPIKVLKFRTMRAARDAEGRRLSDAERLSPVGRLLRRMRLDELPQIYNVLLGQMSMIGPRPLLPVDQSPRFAGRLEMRPGLTGWAQINGGRHLSIHDKAALDLWYVQNASIGVDFRILFMTARTVLFGERINSPAIREAWRALGRTPPADRDTTEMIDRPSLEVLARSGLDTV
jgi:lipopolysaccharide/colanic/teichoic acid biosynthesis glycosyltransferase